MTTGAAGEAARAEHRFAGANRVHPATEFVSDRVFDRQRPLLVDGCPIASHAALRECGDRFRERDGGAERLALLDEPIDETEAERFLARHGATGENHVERTALTDESRQSNGSAVDERHTPTPAEYTEHGVTRGHPEITKQRELQPARDGVTFDGGDCRLAKSKTTETHRAVAGFFPRRGLPRVVETKDARGIGNRFQVGTGAERSAAARDDGNRERVIAVEATQGRGELGSRFAIDGVACLLPPIERDDRDGSLGFEEHDVCHDDLFADGNRRGRHGKRLREATVRAIVCAMSTNAETLAEVPLFALLDDQERAILAERVEIVQFPKGTVIFQFGDPGDSMYIVRSGEVALSVKTKTGEEIFLERPSAGDFFGEISLLDEGPRTAAARAASDVEALVVDRGDLDELFRLKPAAAMDLLAATGRRLRQTSLLLRNAATRNVNEEVEDKRTRIMKTADWIADFSGSLPFLFLHLAFFALWIGLNLKLPPKDVFDSYPFGFLTLVVSLEAIILSVFVLLSQNRQVAREKVRSDIEYDVNLKAEMQIAHMHEKVDGLYAEMQKRLDRIEKRFGIEGSIRPST